MALLGMFYSFSMDVCTLKGFPRGSVVKNLPAKQEPKETWVQSLGREDPLKKGMATHSSIPAWRIPTDRGARRATFHKVTKSRTQLKHARNF